MESYTVYRIIFNNGKSYIGYSVDFNTRQYHHLWKAANKATLPIQKALNKYSDSVKWEIIADNLSELEAKRIEVLKIKEYKSLIYENGYNCTVGGEGTSGYKKSKESIQKWRVSIKATHESPEYRNKISESKKKSCENPQVRKNISEGQKNRFSKEEELIKLSERIKKSHSTAETKLKISNSQKARFSKEEEKLKLSKASKTYHSNPDNKIKFALSVGAKYFYVLENDIIVGEYLIISECAKQLGLDRICISNCLRGKQKKHKKYTFKYKE